MRNDRIPQEGALRTIRIYAADIRGLMPEIERELGGGERTGTVSAERIERARRFLRAEDAHRCVGAGLLLYRAVERETGGIRGELRTERDEKGKPYMPDLPDLHFNLSHSGDMIFCAVDCRPVGVDVERIREIDPDVAQSCFTPGERKRLEGKEGEEWLRAFYRLWTLKESFLKALGTGLGRNPLSLEVVPADREERFWRAEENRTLQVLPTAPEYAAAVCGEGEWESGTVEWLCGP